MTNRPKNQALGSSGPFGSSKALDALNLGPNCLTFLATYRCTAACENCCFGSHPWIEGRIPQADILRHIREAADIGTVQLVCFSGGECFLLGDDLIEAIQLAHSLGLATRCVTNGYWASNGPVAERVLRRFMDAGLTEINFSTGDKHAQFVPVENVIWGTHVAQCLGLTVAIMVELSGSRRTTKQTLVEHPLFNKLVSNDPSRRPFINESPWVSLDKGCDQVVYDNGELLNGDTLPRRKGCDSILKDIVVTPQNDLKICCGITSEQIPETRLGSLDGVTMQELYAQGSDDFLKIWIAVDGPERILAWASTIDESIEWENVMSHQCDACLRIYRDERIRRIIRDHYPSVVNDVLLRYSLKAT